VEHLARRNFNELSGGERQRVKIALALAQDPQLLLLDEPAQHLDIGRQAEVFSVLRRLSQEGITIMAAVHDLRSAYLHFASGILLRPGSSPICGPPATILTAESIQQVFGIDSDEFERSAIVPSMNGHSLSHDDGVFLNRRTLHKDKLNLRKDDL